ncbi:hypothetical protein BH09CHL1_BH09CHL1_11900 [soil metagenome]
MNADRFDTVARLFASRRLTRRALAQGGVGLTASAVAVGFSETSQAQEASPVPTPDADRGPETLFVQSFQHGSIVPMDGSDDTFTLTLEGGLGQTIYFSDRPARDVGVTPTPTFLANLGFPAENPPNAALVVTADDDTDITIVELFNPRYDEATHTATYDVTLLKEWESKVDLGFAEAPTDLAELHPTFGAAHLFIDDCLDYYLICKPAGAEGGFKERSMGFCYSWLQGYCLPCEPWYKLDRDATAYWAGWCNDQHPAECQGNCSPDWFPNLG